MAEIHADDFVMPFQIETSGARGRLIRLGPALTAILGQHDYPPPVSMLLGEAITLAAMLGASLKIDGGSFILQTRSDGPVSFLVAHYHAPGRIRGYASFDPSAFAEAAESGDHAPAPLGKGHLAMTIDPGPGMERYQGVVALEGESLTDTADVYFRQSEQIPSFIRIAVAHEYTATPAGEKRWGWRAGGLMVQKLTDEGGAAPARARTNGHEPDEAWERARMFAATVEDFELLEPALPAERLLYRLFHEESVRAFEAAPLTAFCQCSEERVGEMLGRFSSEEIGDMTQDGRVEVTCEFCNRRYAFDADALRTRAE